MRRGLLLSLIALALPGCDKRQEPQVCVPVLPGWVTDKVQRRDDLRADFFISNTVNLAGNGILWNGNPVDERTLVDYTRQLAPKSPVPFLIFDPGPSPDCSFARHVRDILDQNYPCRKGVCGQGPTTNFIPRFNGPEAKPRR
jgi:hypothetical protein